MSQQIYEGWKERGHLKESINEKDRLCACSKGREMQKWEYGEQRKGLNWVTLCLNKDNLVGKHYNLLGFQFFASSDVGIKKILHCVNFIMSFSGTLLLNVLAY